MAIEQDADDSSWPEAELINEHVRNIRILFRWIKGLGVLILTWTTVVLLGGFVSDLEMKDFWSLTVVTVIQLPGAFDFPLTEKIRELRREMSPKLYDDFMKFGDTLSRIESLFDIIIFAFVASFNVLLILVTSVICLPLVVFLWFGLYVSTGISLWRLVEHSHGNTDGGANLGPSLYILYSIAVAQGVLSVFRSIYSSAMTTKAVKKVEEYYHLNETDLVLQYVTNTRYKKDMASAIEDGRRWNLVTYGMDLLRKSETPEKHLSAVRAVFSASCSKRLRPLKQLLIGHESFNPMISKLLQMMHPKSLYSRETRENAAGIVVLLADQIHLEQFPGGVHSIASLLDTSEEHPWLPEKCQWCAFGPEEESDQRDLLLEIINRNMFLQGLYIFGKLANDYGNCRIISKAEGLMSRITAPLSSILLHRDHHKEWIKISKQSLMLMCSLMAVPGDTGRIARRQIASNDKAIIRMLHIILGCDEYCNIFLSIIAVEIMLELSVDSSSIMASRKCSRRLVTVLIGIFLKKHFENYDIEPFKKLSCCINWKKKRSYIRNLAGEKLASISLQSQNNAMAMLHEVVDDAHYFALQDITDTLVADTNNTCRTRAAEILEHLCSNCTNDDEYLKSLNKAVLDKIPKVLTEILEWGSTGASTQAETEANQLRYSAADTDIEEGPASPDNGQKNIIYFSHQQKDGDNKLHEALLSLCETVYQKLISTDSDMASWFDEIASRICSEQRKPPKPFTLLVEEAREIVKMKNA